MDASRPALRSARRSLAGGDPGYPVETSAALRRPPPSSKTRLQTPPPAEREASIVHAIAVGGVAPAVDNQREFEPERPAQVLDAVACRNPHAGVVQRRVRFAGRRWHRERVDHTQVEERLERYARQ